MTIAVDISVPAAPDDDVRLLIGELDAALAIEYPPEHRHGLAFDSLFAPHVTFFIARLNQQLAGCGAVALFENYAEVKRMYVRPHLRGQGVAPALLDRIVAATRQSGISVLRLETGTKQPAAVKLYERYGFRSCPVFGNYAAMPPNAIVMSLFYEMTV